MYNRSIPQKLIIIVLRLTCIVNAVRALALGAIVPGQLDAARRAASEQPLLLAARWDRRRVLDVRQEVHGEVELKKEQGSYILMQVMLVILSLRLRNH